MRATHRKCSYAQERERLFDGRALAPCFWCGRMLRSFGATIDHLIPLGEGGTNDDDNMVLACDTCNGQRGRIQQLTAKTREPVDLYQRARALYAAAMGWRRPAWLNSELQPLLATVRGQGDVSFDHCRAVVLAAWKRSQISCNQPRRLEWPTS